MSFAVSRVPVNFVNFQGLPILKQLYIEEWLLRKNEENWCIVNHQIEKPSIVLGISGIPDKMCYLENVKRDNIELLRRFSGGGTVIVDEDTLFFSLIMNKDSLPNVEPFPRSIMNWTGELYSPVFKDLLSPFSSPFAVRENDYVLGDLKIAGNAQSIVKDKWLHHTSFLWKFKDSNMQYLKVPEKQPQYRSGRPHSSFLTPLHLHVQRQDQFIFRFQRRLEELFFLTKVNQDTLLQKFECANLCEPFVFKSVAL